MGTTGGPTVVCGHRGPEAGVAVCSHLRSTAPGHVPSYFWYTGIGLSMEILCEACTFAREHDQVITAQTVCTTCYRALTNSVLVKVGVRGAPELREDLRPVQDPVIEVAVRGLTGALRDLAFATDSGTWFALCADNSIVNLAADWSTDSLVAMVDLALPANEEGNGSAVARRRTARPERSGSRQHGQHRFRLHSSPSGRFVAVVVDFGTIGVVIDVETKTPTMRLDNSNRYAWTVPFPAAFASMDGRDVLVHQTDSSRLDLSDPADGSLLTARALQAWSEDEPDPPHYLDYFHGRLYVSPDGRHIVDDG